MKTNLRKIIGTGAAALLLMGSTAAAERIAPLRAALSAVGQGDFSRAGAQAEQAGPVARDLVAWHKLRAGQGAWADYADFITRNPDWPGLDLMRRRAEAALLAAPAPAPRDVLAVFAEHMPTQFAVAEAIAAAQRALGDEGAADETLRAAWRVVADAPPDAPARYGAALAGREAERVFSLLDEGAWQAAEAMLPVLPPDIAALAQARIAVQSGRSGVDDLILALPQEAQADAGLALDRFEWRLANRLRPEAQALLRERSTSPEALHLPARWAEARIDFTRAALREGDWALAEELATRHFLPEGDSHFDDLAFLAGYAALKAGAPDRALAQFDALADAVGSAISQARAAYWQGRALAAQGKPEDARAAYSRAAQFGSAYYGQLALQELGQPFDAALLSRALTDLPDWRAEGLRDDPVFAAGAWALVGGDAALAQRFFLARAQTATPAQIGAMSRLMAEAHQPWYALRLAKRAADHGVIYPATYFPMTGLETRDLGVPPELVMAVARRESEFNPSVGSPVGAEGLMQLMPDTARQVARQLGLGFDQALLTQDWAYNAQLGASYLEGLRARFGPSVALVAVGYNAGPGRAAQWLERFGDLRRGGDPVDWVEAIPFDETRVYVMRVAEAQQVYRARIAQSPLPVTLREDLTGGGVLRVAPQADARMALNASRRAPQPADPAAIAARAEAAEAARREAELAARAEALGTARPPQAMSPPETAAPSEPAPEAEARPAEAPREASPAQTLPAPWPIGEPMPTNGDADWSLGDVPSGEN